MFFTLQCFCKNEKNVHIQLGIDNTAYVHYINQQGGKKKSLNEICRNIWLWAFEREIWLTATHVPGVLNVEADTASRKHYALEGEWQLHSDVFQSIQ